MDARSLVLNNDDLVCLIASQFNVSIRGHMATLARAGRVCKSFYEPAMGALWRTLDGFKPLARLLPRNAATVSTILSSSCSLDLRTLTANCCLQIENTTLPRFLGYTRRIRGITICYLDSVVM